MTYRSESPIKTKVSLDRISFLADKFLRVSLGLPFGIITSKGEPTLAPKEELGDIIEVLYAAGKGLIPELQTNGTRLTPEAMGYWKDKGLNTLALSCVSHLDEVNSQILSNGEITWDIERTVTTANEMGLLVRLTVILTKGGVDSADSLLTFLEWAKNAGAHQITFRKMGKPRNLSLPGSSEVAQWITRNSIKPDFILSELATRGAEQDSLPWAQIFTYGGLSVVVTDHMNPPKDGIVRHAIIQPDGRLHGSWDDPGIILI
jgi:hypothetical protein